MAKTYKSKKKLSKSKTIEIIDDILSTSTSTSSLQSSPCLFKPPIYIGKKRSYSQSLSKKEKEKKEKKSIPKPMPNKRGDRFQAYYG